MTNDRALLHDMMNCLGAAKGFSEWLLMDNELPEAAKEKVRRIATNCHMACVLGSRIMDKRFAGPCPPKMVTVHEIFKKLKILTSVLPAPVSVRCASSSNGRSVIIDEVTLDRVLANCVDNAVKAGATKLIVESRHDPLFIEVVIKDNGKGMTPEEIDKLGFGFTTDGHGIGSRVLLDLISAAGGSIKWSSIKDIGTSVSLKLKCLEEPVPQ